MPRQQSGDLRRDELLEAVAITYMQDRGLYVAHKVFPFLNVNKSSGFFRTYTLGDLVRIQAAPRSPGTEAQVQSVGSSDAQYQTRQEALKDFITDEDYGDDAGPIKVRDIRAMGVTQGHITRLEVRWGQAYFTTGVWGTDLTGVASATPNAAQFRQFDHSGCDPVYEVLRIKNMMGSATGFEPNVMVITNDVFRSLLTNSLILDRLKGGATTGNPAMANEKILASLFGLDELLVSKAVINSAAEGATDSIARMFTNRMLFAYRTSTPSKDVPSAGYTFVWTTPDNVVGNPSQIQVFSYYREELGREDIEARMHYDQKVTASNLGIYCGSVLANP